MNRSNRLENTGGCFKIIIITVINHRVKDVGITFEKSNYNMQMKIDFEICYNNYLIY